MSDKKVNWTLVEKLREHAFNELKQLETVSYAFHSYAHHEQDKEITSEDLVCLMNVVESMVISVSNSVRAWMAAETATEHR